MTKGTRLLLLVAILLCGVGMLLLISPYAKTGGAIGLSGILALALMTLWIPKARIIDR